MTSQLQTDMVRALLASRGFNVEPEVILGRGLWKGIRADYVAHGIEGYPDGLAIECKWQNSTGSASEKLAYLVINIQRHYPIPCMIVCGGAELEEARKWAASEVGGRLVAVYGTDEFIAWVGAL